LANPVTTTLSSIITLALQQMGSRFQVSVEQLVAFANTIQYIAYNKDVDAFVEYEQEVILGYDIYLNFNNATYTEPINSDITLEVVGNTVGEIGTLLNYGTLNRSNKWIVAPVNGITTIPTIPAGEIISLSGAGVDASFATGVVSPNQSFEVSNGPYRMPDAIFGNPACRKLIGITKVTDAQKFGTSPGGDSTGYNDYGMYLNSTPGRHQNYPYQFNIEKQEVTLVASTPPEITIVSDGSKLPGGEGITTSKLRWIYYKNPPPITDVNDDASLILPERYRYEVIFKGISLLADIATYGEAGTIRQLIEPVCERFWDDMRDQYEAYGRNNSYISEGDTWVEPGGISYTDRASPYFPGTGW